MSTKLIAECGVAHFKGISVKEKGAEGEYVLVPSGAVFPGHIKLDRCKRFTDDPTKLSQKFLQADDVLFNSGGVGTLGRSHHIAAIEPKTYVPDSFVLVLRTNGEQLLSKYLYYYLQSPAAQELIQDNTRGTTGITSIKSEAVLGFPISCPSLVEQQRIVRQLDDVFGGIAIATANAEKNHQNARAIFEGSLQAVFTQDCDAWINKRLGELSHIQYGYTESSSIKKVGPHFLRITDIQDNNVNWDAVPYCPIEAGDFRKFQLHDGDIVFARTGATTGKSYLVSDPPNSVFASYLIRVQLQGKELLPAFLNLYFQTQSYWDAIRSGVSGSAQGGFNATKLGELAIPFPQSIEMQQSLVGKLELLNGAVSNLKDVYERKNAALNALASSLLERAFSGAMNVGG